MNKSVLDVIAGRIDKDTGVVPCSRFDSSILVQRTENFQFSVTNHDRMFGQQRNKIHIVGPHDVPTFTYFH
jgi:hypothetical protein